MAPTSNLVARTDGRMRHIQIYAGRQVCIEVVSVKVKYFAILTALKWNYVPLSARKIEN